MRMMSMTRLSQTATVEEAVQKKKMKQKAGCEPEHRSSAHEYANWVEVLNFYNIPRHLVVLARMYRCRQKR